MMHALFSSKERGFWEARIEAAAGDSNKCWQTMNKLMCKDSKCKIPDSATAEFLQNSLFRRLMLFALPHLLQMLLFSHPVLSHVPLSHSNQSPQNRFFF